MIYGEMLILGVGAIAAVVMAIINKEKDSIPCESCEHLIRKGGGLWKYECLRNEYGFTEHFDRPPTYCKYYQKRGKKNGQN